MVVFGFQIWHDFLFLAFLPLDLSKLSNKSLFLVVM